jgi:hypothetical protein
MNHFRTVQISQRAFALGVAATLYDQCCLEEQRILREYNRVMERLEKCREDKFRYGMMIGVVE